MRGYKYKYKHKYKSKCEEADLVHDLVGEVVGEHVEDEAVGAGEDQVVEAVGAHLPHQNRPAGGLD